jgi:Ni/Fe-hydrogenase subunit HybB-like protein
VSSIVAGLSMVIVESALSHRIFHSQVDRGRPVDLDRITLGLGRGAAVVLFGYVFLKLQGIAEGGHWGLLGTPYGIVYLVELLGFVLLPSLMFAVAVRSGDVAGVRRAAVIAVTGVVVNRLNVSIVAFNWNAAERYVPSLAEVVVSVTLVTMGVLVFRWIVNRMPVLHEHPGFRGSH